ncbi:DUF3606 domain-containing protein [Methylobacterium komagatae]
MSETQITSSEPTHLHLWDRKACEEFAARMGVSEEKLRKAIRMVGSRVTTLTSHLKA